MGKNISSIARLKKLQGKYFLVIDIFQILMLSNLFQGQVWMSEAEKIRAFLDVRQLNTNDTSGQEEAEEKEHLQTGTVPEMDSRPVTKCD